MESGCNFRCKQPRFICIHMKFFRYSWDCLIHPLRGALQCERKTNKKMQQCERHWAANFSMLKNNGLSTFQLPTQNLSRPLRHTHPSCTSACQDANQCTNPPATPAPPHTGSAESCGPQRGRSPWRGWRTAGPLCCKTGNPCGGERVQWKLQQCSTTTRWITAGQLHIPICKCCNVQQRCSVKATGAKWVLT